MIKYINNFILTVLSIQVISFVLGHGTHFEHYKVVTMMMILIGNQLFLKISKKNLVPSKIRK